MRNTIRRLFNAKKQRRKELGNLPIEKKVLILIQLQKMAVPILKNRGIIKFPWKIQ